MVEFQPNSYTVNEDDGIVTFVLVKRTPTTQDVTVQISTVGGSATSGTIHNITYDTKSYTCATLQDQIILP